MDSLTKRIITILLVVLAAAAVWLPSYEKGSVQSCDCLIVSFLDIGQGDAILIQTPDGYEMLIDGGADVGVLRELSKERGFFDRKIDVMVATHPDLDHIGGLVDVFERYDIGTFIETTAVNDTPAAAALAAAASSEGSRRIEATAGQIIELGNEVYIQILSPVGDETNWQPNNASVIMRVVYGDTAFMLSGDAPAEIEDYLVERYGSQLESDVLKLGHHGSKTSTSELFLDAVQPQYAVVSAGLDNRYGHPHQDVMARVFSRNIQTSHTGTDGTITFYSDGQTVWRK